MTETEIVRIYDEALQQRIGASHADALFAVYEAAMDEAEAECAQCAGAQ